MFRVYGFVWDPPPQTSFPVLDWGPPDYSDPDLFGGGGGVGGFYNQNPPLMEKKMEATIVY